MTKAIANSGTVLNAKSCGYLSSTTKEREYI